MKFKVTGSNRDTGARMILEFEAESRAAAERKAIASGMNVNHVQVMNFGDEQSEELPVRSSHRGDEVRAGAGAKLLAMLIFLIVAAGIVWFFWGKISGLLGR